MSEDLLPIGAIYYHTFPPGFNPPFWAIYTYRVVSHDPAIRFIGDPHPKLKAFTGCFPGIKIPIQGAIYQACPTYGHPIGGTIGKRDFQIFFKKKKMGG